MTKRIEYIDVAKFLAMILVVFAHGFKESAFIAFTYSFHLPLFFFLNGMTLKLEGNFGEFISKKLQRYILPMFGLGVLCVLFNLLIIKLFNNPMPKAPFISGLAGIINQSRTFAIWFLPALFFSDLILYGINRAGRGRLVPMGIMTLAVLGIGILFNIYHNVVLVWNLDATLFGTLFTFAGFLFRHKKISPVYGFLTRNRILSLTFGCALLVATFFISQYNYQTYHIHLEMYARLYRQYYITLPCALIGSLGFTLICHGISNKFLSKPVAMILSLLAFHQVFTFPFFRYIVAKDWWHQVSTANVIDLNYILFDFSMLAFSVAVIAVIHFIIKFSPVSPIINQPLANFYRRKKPAAEPITP